MPDIGKMLGSPSALIASFLWGTIGFGFAIYGKKQESYVPLIGGIALMAGSYFLASSAWIMSLFSIAVIAAIYWLKGRF
jgi:hypothetical protein